MIRSEGLKSLARNYRNGGLSSGWGYLRSRRIRRLLPAITRDLSRSPHELHFLTGHARLTMALWMAASWMLVTKEIPGFIIHDDGSLTDQDEHLIRRLLPASRVIRAEESDMAIRRTLHAYPLCLRCREYSLMTRKFFDIFQFSNSRKLLTIDTDILFFRRPHQILEWLESEKNTSLFLRDVDDVSLPAAESYLSSKGIPLTRSVNCGIIAVHSEIFDFALIEDALGTTDFLNSDPWFIEQSLYAMCASAKGIVDLLPSEYIMSLSTHVEKESVCRHYVGAIRHTFYSEGLRMIKNH